MDLMGWISAAEPWAFSRFDIWNMEAKTVPYYGPLFSVQTMSTR
jgi:hypothetical protein